MSKEIVLPLELKSQLAPNPEGAPRWSQMVRLKSGSELAIADPRATRALVALMDMQAVLGGAASHFGGPAAFAELMSALHGLAFERARHSSQPWHQLFHLINDAGHCENGLYALKANYGFADLTLESLKGFRSIESRLTGHGESHLFPQGVFLSNGPLGSSLAQAQGLAYADALAGKDRMTVVAISDGACMEGEAKEALASIPGLAGKGQLAPTLMIVSDNNTKLSGRIDEQSFSMEPTFQALQTLGWKVLSLEKAHDLQACLETIETAMDEAQKNPLQPVAIHARTIKGYGTKKTAESASGAHGFPLSQPKDLEAFLQEIYQGETVPEVMLQWCQDLVSEAEAKKSSPPTTWPMAVAEKAEKVQVGVAKALIAKKKEGRPIVSVSSDLQGSTGVATFQKEFPQSCLDVGVAEANMVSLGAGLSKAGYIPVVDTFSQFGVTKGALPFLMAALSEAPLIGVFSHIGFQDAADGASHQALSYFAMTHALPHTDTYCLSSSSEAEALVAEAVEDFYQARKQGQVPRSRLFFLGRENFPQWYGKENATYRLGQSQVLFDNSDSFIKSVTVVATGPLIPQALMAASTLADQSIGTIVVNASSINRPDVESVKGCLEKTGTCLLTVEDHQVVGGMGAALIHGLVQAGARIKAHSLGVQDEFGRSAYKAVELYEQHGLDARGIVKAVGELWE